VHIGQWKAVKFCGTLCPDTAVRQKLVGGDGVAHWNGRERPLLAFGTYGVLVPG
jgi:hypothetical protein